MDDYTNMVLDDYAWSVLEDLNGKNKTPFDGKKMKSCKHLEIKGYAGYGHINGCCGYWYATKNGAEALNERKSNELARI